MIKYMASIIMKNEIAKYNENNLVVFSVNIEQEQKEKEWKKKIIFPRKWQNFTLEKTSYNPKYNGLAMLTGKINNIFVIDIDNIDHWNNFLNEHDQKEPKTVKAISGSGGIHLYFKYDEDLDKIKTNTKCFGDAYDIDIRTNGGCIIVYPTKYFNKNTGKECEYIWETYLCDSELKSVPKWLKKILLSDERIEKKEKKKKQLLKDNNDDINISNFVNIEDLNIDPDDNEIDFSSSNIESLVNMLSPKRCDNYNDWVSVGMCLFNIDKNYMVIWERWSQKSKKYEEGSCKNKWNSFKKDKDGLKLGSLLLWAKSDNPLKYEKFIKKTKLTKIIDSKFPKDKLILGETVIVNDKCQYTNLHNKECLIKGETHTDMPHSMYIEILDKFMTIKCRHPECFGKTYPCQHILMNKNEMNFAFHGNVNITIQNGKDDELVEFQEINIYDDNHLNELVYNSLNGEAYPLAEIVYYYFKDTFNYGEDENWYIFLNHKWENLGKKNMSLRHWGLPKLKELYSDLILYYKDNDYDKNKVKSIKQIIKSFDNTNLKNNILTELMEIYSMNNNPKRDFTKKLDSNNFLIGFNNGIYDLKKFEFREGKPEDFVTLSVGYDYQEIYSDKYNDLLCFLEDIQPNKEEREYMLTYLSIGLIGNVLELFTILTGSGRNGKSKLIELLKLTLGDYFGSVQSQLFTRPRPDANSPDPGLLSLAKKRIVMASEPEKNSKLNSGFIKFITGRDSTTLRTCHSNNMVDFTANFITLLICNDIPDCDDIDNAFSKRLRCINFPTEFVNEPTKENQKKINVNINKNFDLWKLDFMLLLIKYYKNYSETYELKPTENILKWTDQYKEDTDLYLQFLNECTEENKEESIHCSTLYEEFKNWFKGNNPNTKIPSNKEFVANLRKYKEVKKILVNEKILLGIKNLKLV